jgi:hypothetical protein
MNFEVVLKKIHINTCKHQKHFIVCVNHNRQYNDGRKSSMILKLLIFTTHVVNAKLLIAINY